jgi:hypothetical protein
MTAVDKYRIIEVLTQKDWQDFFEFGYRHAMNYSFGSIDTRKSELALFEEIKGDKNSVFRCYLCFDDKEVVGRIAVFVKNQSIPNAYLGCFSSKEDIQVAKALFNSVEQFANENTCQRLIGPLNYSIFDNYRLMTEGFDEKPFLGEPRNPQFYNDFFHRCGFKESTNWETVKLNNFMSNPFQVNLKNYQNFLNLGYTIKPFAEYESSELINNCYDLLKEAYKVFPFYGDIDKEVFAKKYADMPKLVDQNCSIFLYDASDNLVGLLIILRDLFETVKTFQNARWFEKWKFILNSREGKSLYMIHGASLPRYIRRAYAEGKRAFNSPVSLTLAALYKSFDLAIKSGKYSSAYITLMREGAEIRQYFKYHSKTSRKYCLFEKDIDA